MSKIVLLLLVLLSACVSQPTSIVAPSQPTKIRIDSRLLQPCPPLLYVTSPEEFPTVVLKNIELYDECKSKQDNSIRVIKELSNSTGVSDNGRQK